MTLDDAKKLADIFATVDHGCSICIGDICEEANAAFPEFFWEMGTEADTVNVSKR